MYLTSKIYKKNESFSRPKGIKSVKIELETFPAQLCSSHTPENMCVSEYFVSGTEPTDSSNRYATLDNPTNGSYEVNSNLITIKWDGIAIPEAINSSYLSEHFKKYYYEHADDYYNNRLKYNSSTIGTQWITVHVNMY